MTGYLLRRTVSSLFILWGVSILVFLIIRLVPGDPITTMLGIASVSDPGLVAKFRAAYGLDQPLPIQYLAWLRHMATGEFGTSITTGQPVGRYVVSRFEASLFLGIVATLFAGGLGLLLGVGEAYTRGFVRGLIRFVTLLGIAIASISIGVAFSYVFAVRLRWLPPSGMHSPISNGGVVDPLRHVCRAHRRDRAGGRVARAPGPSVHAGAPQVRAEGQPPPATAPHDDRHRRRCLGAQRGLPFRAALPARHRPVPSRRALSCSR